jgi:hypothetical protein
MPSIATAILRGDGDLIPEPIITRFLGESEKIDPETRDSIVAKIRQYN